MTHAVEKTTSQIASVVTLITIFLFPLFLLPTTTNFYDFNKLALLAISASILLVIFSAKTLITKTFHFEVLPFITPLFIFGLIHFASPFITSPKNIVDSLMSRGSFFLILSLFVAMATNLINERKFIRHASYALIGSGTLLAIITLFQSFGFGLSNLINSLAGTSLPNTLAFTPAGSPVALLTFLVPLIALSLVLAFTKTDAGEKVSLFVLSAIMASTILVVALYASPGKDASPIFLPLQAGYAIAIDSLKTPKTALFGFGTNSFSIAFNQLRSSSLNLGNLWNIRFGASSTEILHLVTTVGLTGAIAFGLILTTMLKMAKTPQTGIQLRSLKLAAFIATALFFFVPGNFVLYFAFAVLLGLWAMAAKFANYEAYQTLDLQLDPNPTKPQTAKQIGIFAPPALIIAAVGALLYFGSKTYTADMTFKKSLDAAAKNDGLTTYNLQRQAIIQNPYLPRYRRSYATTNLALANALASNKDITDQDKQNVAQLIQQAIREAKVATSLEPTNVVNWESLSGIYQALIGSAQDADQWTVAALAQAIQVDPTNPSLRVSLGGIYYSLKAYDQAIRLFQQAAELKPDYANAYYNLSHAYLEKKDVVAAFDYMRQTLSLTQADSADYTKAKDELEALSKQLPKTANQAPTGDLAPAQTELQTASPAPSPAAEVNLPSDSGPENIPTVNP